MQTVPDFKEKLTRLMMGPLSGPNCMAPKIIRAVTQAVRKWPAEKETIAYSFSFAVTRGLTRPNPTHPDNTGYISPAQCRFLSEMNRVISTHPFLESSLNEASSDALRKNCTKPEDVPFAITLLHAHRTNLLPPLEKPYPFNFDPFNFGYSIEGIVSQLNRKTGIALQTSALDIGKLFIELDHQPELTVGIGRSVRLWVNLVCHKRLHGLIPSVTEHLNTKGRIYQQITSSTQECGYHLEKPDLLSGQTGAGLPIFYDAANGAGESPADWVSTKFQQAQTSGLTKDLVAIHAPFALAYLARQLKETDPTEPLAGYLEAEMVSIFNTASKTDRDTPKIRRRLVWAAHSGTDPNEQRRAALQARAPKPAPQLKLGL